MSFKARIRYFDKVTITLWTAMLVILAVMMTMAVPGILDSRLFYTYEEASLFLNSLSEQSLSSYIKIAKLDLAFIFVYSLLLLMSLKKVFPTKEWVCAAGILPGSLDLFETCNILVYLKNPTDNSIFSWLGYVTCAKWVTGAIVVFIFVTSFLQQRRLRSSDSRF